MSNPLIESLCALKLDDAELPSWFKVGEPHRRHTGWEVTSDGERKAIFTDYPVTMIVPIITDRGDYQEVWFNILSGEIILASISSRNTAEIYYQIPKAGSSG